MRYWLRVLSHSDRQVSSSKGGIRMDWWPEYTLRQGDGDGVSWRYQRGVQVDVGVVEITWTLHSLPPYPHNPITVLLYVVVLALKNST